jgi:hypothetical protein
MKILAAVTVVAIAVPLDEWVSRWVPGLVAFMAGLLVGVLLWSWNREEHI